MSRTYSKISSGFRIINRMDSGGFSKRHVRRFRKRVRETPSNQQVASTSTGPVPIEPAHNPLDELLVLHCSDDSDDELVLREVDEEELEDIELFEDDIDDIIEGKLKEDVLIDLRKWVLETSTPARHVTKLLKVLNKHFGDKFPKDSRSLMKTPRASTVPQVMGDGEYFHYGIARGWPLTQLRVSKPDMRLSSMWELMVFK